MSQINQMNRNYQMNQNYQMNRSNTMNGNYQSQRNSSCPCQQKSALESMSQQQLFNYLNEVSFAVEDIILFLDTHPCDCEALEYCNEMVSRRREALDVYARRFGALTLDTTNECAGNRWEWIMQPWPWEPKSKGGCR